MQDRNKTSASMSGQESRELRSFGRRRGRALSPRQQGLLQDVLPGVQLDFATPAPTPLTSLFKAPTSEVWLEIGFGGAEHLLWQAQNNPTAGLIGCEPFEEGVVKALSAIEQNALSNIRLHPDDARDILRWLPATSIDRAFVLFPDAPWGRAAHRHRYRRLLAHNTYRLPCAAAFFVDLQGAGPVAPSACRLAANAL